MLGLIRSILGKGGSAGADVRERERASAPEAVAAEGLPAFRVVDHIIRHNGFPIVDWGAVDAWVRGASSDEAGGTAWTECERAWLMHFRDALGPDFTLAESQSALLVTSLDSNVRRATLQFMDRALERVTRLLGDIAHVPSWGKDILVIFPDAGRYYDYVSYYYPAEGEFALSGGMHISTGCGHFVTVESSLDAMEPVVVHEMTHGCLAHLPLPRWLDEGIAVNTEARLAGLGSPEYTPRQMHEKHLAFWGKKEIQEFWSGTSFYHSGDSNLLSYDLARVLVEQMSADWKRFTRFVREADWRDGGAASAEKHLDIDLGRAVCAMLERPSCSGWVPDPGRWKSAADCAHEEAAPARNKPELEK